jgi:hypothetical protein
MERVNVWLPNSLKAKEDIKYKLLNWLKYHNEYIKNRKLNNTTFTVCINGEIRTATGSEYVSDILKSDLKCEGSLFITVLKNTLYYMLSERRIQTSAI